MDLSERCPDCGAAGSIHDLGDGGQDEGICVVCCVHVRRSLMDGRWKVRTYCGWGAMGSASSGSQVDAIKQAPRLGGA